MGEKDNLSILVKSVLKYNETEKIDEQLKKLEEKLKPFTRKIEITSDTIKSINDSYKIILDKNKGVNNELIPTKTPDIKISNQLDRLLEKYSINDIISFILYGAAYLSSAFAIRKFADVVEELTKTEKAIIKAQTLLSEAGFAPNKEIDKTFIKAINECECIENVRTQRKIIAQLAIDHYGERLLKNMLSQWNEHPLVKKRIKVLENAIAAHVHKNYLLSIPVLLAQIEGIVMDGFYHVGDYKHERLGIYLPDMTPKRVQKARNTLMQNILPEHP